MVKQDKDIINRLTTRAVEHIYPSTTALKKLLISGKRLNVYQGFDPTADSLHIGHTVGMRKLRDFQLLGHNVTFLIGDFTGRVGDPTDKSATRQKLTKEQVEKNMKLYKDQASKILNFDDKKNPVNVRYNSEWHDKLRFPDILELASEFTVQQMLKRDMFKKRLEEDKPIYIHEFMYPLMQSYDAFMMDTDVEIGGNDQTFNMLCGRDLIAAWKKKEKIVISGKLLEDPTGTKMGKSEGNMIMLSDSPEDVYGKIMAFTDGMIISGFEILTDVPMDEIEKMQKDLDKDSVNPMDLKKKLAFTITAEHKGEKASEKAQQHFESVFQKRDAQADTIEEKSARKKKVGVVSLLTDISGFAESNSDAKRLITQSAVSIDGKKVTDKNADVTIPPEGITLKVGRKITRITQ